ncbi:murein biosynthesis integral membrane protein MurJ [Rossellomorea vietnamensis]|uniref:murein biosynthesis integral membrane protein MurJ n=1 Tax=Rossellomorea vietnamensis TaxID=218284 RepID=UPI001E46C1A8|nr:murein biosynthesis integral membrane protein MurJ [Rossellomorea vietnamensis]MCC5803170.1 murein biosynthesis integral membrane protein MurJ [Rossellomorea vietnamensis]
MKLSTFVKSIGLVTIISGVGKLLGFARESIIAAYFGTSEVADVFFVSSLVPTLLFTAIGTAIQAGTIPLFMEERSKNEEDAKKLMSLLGTFFLVLSLLLIGVTLLFTQPLIKVMAPGFTTDQIALAVKITRIMIPSMIFLTLTSISTGVLNANKQFVLPAFSATIQNVVIILATILLANTYGVYGLSIGVLIGAAGQFFIQYPSFKKSEIGFNFHFQEHKEKIFRILILFYPIIIAAISVQLNSLVDRMVSTGLETGSVSALNYGNRLLWLPLSVILTPLITVLYPSLVEGVLESYKKFFSIIQKGTSLILFASIPFTLLMVLIGDNLIELAFQRGSFNREATDITYQALFYYALGLVFFALRDFLMNGFYALKRTKIAMYSCLGAVLVNIVLSITLSKFMAVGGIALASSISMLMQCVVLFFYLLKQYEDKRNYSKQFMQEAGKLSLVTIGVLIIAIPIMKLIPDDLNVLFETTLMTILIFAGYLALSIVFKVNAIQPLTKKIKVKRS